jgi:hypothetical protein
MKMRVNRTVRQSSLEKKQISAAFLLRDTIKVLECLTGSIIGLWVIIKMIASSQTSSPFAVFTYCFSNQKQVLANEIASDDTKRNTKWINISWQ